VTVLVDSDVIIEVSRGKDQKVLSRWTELSQSEVTILYSPVTAAELWAGARPREHEALRKLFRALTCGPIDSETGRQALLFVPSASVGNTLSKACTPPKSHSPKNLGACFGSG
jgi:hypothetical protein